jgi:peroxiredoxin
MGMVRSKGAAGVIAARLAGAVLFIMAAVLFGVTQRARAEFKVGAPLPDFSLKTADDDATFSLQIKKGQLLVTQDDQQLEAKVLVLHLFQPDCLQCQAELKALEAVREKFGKQGVLVVGVAHRGDAEAVRVLAKQLKVTFPLLVGKGSALAKEFAAGDSLAITDGKGMVRFAQFGFGEGDPKVWQENIEQLLAGKPVAKETVQRKALRVDDRLPLIELPSVTTGKTIALTGEGGRLTFRNEEGEVSHPKAAVGFFSRYWSFSREEMVHLQKFHKQYAKDGLFVFAIAMLPDHDKVKKLTKDLDLTYPVFFGAESDVGKRYAFGWPAYIIDAGGVIRYTQVGFEQGDEKKYEKVIEELIKAK